MYQIVRELVVLTAVQSVVSTGRKQLIDTDAPVADVATHSPATSGACPNPARQDVTVVNPDATVPVPVTEVVPATIW